MIAPTIYDPKAELKAQARAGLLDFVRYTMPSYEVNWHHRAMCDWAEKLLRGECDRLMILVPPRHGKSQIISRHLPAFIFGQNPDAQIISCSYAADLASRMNRDTQRIIDTDIYRELFPGTTLNNKNISSDARGGRLRNSEIFEIIGHQGSYRSAGIGQGITGMGFTCFVGSTNVITTLGTLPIATLVELSPPPRVLSFNHQTQSLEWRNILATRTKLASDFIEITLHSGSQIRCTPEHLIFEPQSGYKPACDFVSGEAVVHVNPVQELRDVRKQNVSSNSLQPLLSEDSRLSVRNEMRLLWHRIREAAGRGGEEFKKGFQRLLLRAGMQQQASRSKKSSALQGLQCQPNDSSYGSLLRRMQAFSKTVKSSTKKGMQCLQRTFSAAQRSICLLLKTMSEPSTLSQNAGQRQQSLQGWQQLCRLVRSNAHHCFAARQRLLRGLRSHQYPGGNKIEVEKWRFSEAIDANHSPYQRRNAGQPPGESCNTLRSMPQEPSPNNKVWQTDTISLVERIRATAEPVYDIQIEGNSNFFANGILAHNCGLIDDPLKNREEAESKTVRDGIWEWYTSTFRTRAERGAKIIVCLTPWHPDDLAGRLLKVAKENPKADQWTVVKFPAIATADRHPDDPRQEGEALWPGKYPLEDLERIRASIGPYDWQSLYQCSPTLEGGNLFDEAWWHYWLALPKLDRVIVSLNAKFKEVSSASFVTLQVWGRAGSNYYLLDQVRDRLSFLDVQAVVGDLVARWAAKGVTVHELYLERKQNGKAILESLSVECPVTITATDFNGDTPSGRAQAVVGLFKTGHVFLPPESEVLWVTGLKTELGAFPNAESEDQTGALTQALIYLALRQTNRPYEKFNRAMNGLRGQDAIDFGYDKSLDLHVSFDWNRSPACAGVGQVRGDEVFVLKEWYIENSSTFEVTEAVGQWIVAQGHRRAIHVHGDATGRNQTANSTQSNWDIFWATFKRLGLKPFCRKRYKDANPAESDRVISVNYLFMAERAFVLLEQCPELVIDLENVQWGPDGKIDKKIDLRRTHPTDWLGYMLHDLFPYRQQGAKGGRSVQRQVSGLAG